MFYFNFDFFLSIFSLYLFDFSLSIFSLHLSDFSSHSKQLKHYFQFTVEVSNGPLISISGLPFITQATMTFLAIFVVVLLCYPHPMAHPHPIFVTVFLFVLCFWIYFESCCVLMSSTIVVVSNFWFTSSLVGRTKLYNMFEQRTCNKTSVA